MFPRLWARLAQDVAGVHTVPVLPDRPGRGVPIVEEVTPLEPLQVAVRLPEGDWSRGWLNIWQRDEHGWWGFVTTYRDGQPVNRWLHRSALRLPSEAQAAEESPAEEPPSDDVPAAAAEPGDVPSGG